MGKEPSPTDPHPNPKRFLNKVVSFDHNGKRLVGTIESQIFTGYTAKGSIPDYQVTIRGKSGAAVTVSLVESRISIQEP